MEKSQVVNHVNQVNIPVDSKTAIEASKAIEASDKKQVEKKVDITSNEHVFLTWFMLLLQKLLETTKTVHGQCMESKPYMILFDALKKQGYSLSRFGALNASGKSKTLDYSNVFPVAIPNKTKNVKDGVIYNAIKNSKEFKVFSADKKRYLHYVNNRFHVFHLSEPVSVASERETLKRIEAQTAKEIEEKEKTQKAIEAKKESEKK